MNSLPVSPSQAADELLKRRSARTSLIGFTEYTNPRYETAKPHRIIAAHLERVERGEVDRLMLLCPPRHGKSELASRRFPGFVLGRNPEKEFISVSAGADLAGDFGRDVRNLIVSERYQKIFSTRLAEDSQAKNKWRTEAEGGYYAVGVGGQFMGRGANILLIDDPFASMAAAQSPLERKKVWDWYTGTAYNRLQPNGAIILINHRMHDDDLSGRIIAQQSAGGDKFEIVELPAISDDGEALWGEKFPLEALERIRINSVSRYFSALYLQKPVPDTGDYFKREWLIPVDKTPPRESLRVYGGSDYAVTAAGGDYTIHAVLGLDPDGNPWMLDIWRQQAASDVWVESFCDLVIKWRPVSWAEETGQIKSGVGPFLDREMRARHAYTAREQFPTRGGDKAVRAQSFRGLIATRGLRIPSQAAWRADFEAELLRFPAGVHDDQVDACITEDAEILMADGSRRVVKNVVAGDFVATPIGPCEVLRSWETNPAAQVYRVTVGGRSLIATGNHPIFVDGDGFVRVDALRIGDHVVMEPPCLEGRRKPRSLNTVGIGIEDTPKARAKRTSAIFTGPNLGGVFFTGTFGKTNAALFRRAMRFITETKTLLTTKSETSRASRRKSIARCIFSPGSLTLASWRTLRASEPRPQHGTLRPMASCGIASTVRRLGLVVRSFARSVRRADLSSMHISSGLVFAQVGVSNGATAVGHQNEDGLQRTARLSPASAVIESLSRSGPRSPITVPKHVGCVTAIEALSAPARVRNLTVNRAHVFYANGFLTHNCGLIGQLLDKMQSGPKPSAPEARARDDYRESRAMDMTDIDPLTV